MQTPEETPATTSAQLPGTKKEILGWAMYDVADSSFTTVIVSVFYAVYFTKIVAGGTGYGDSLWALANSASGVAVALIAPILGAIADFSGARKKFLGLCAVVIVVFTGALYVVKPGMVFALETYCPAVDGLSAARIEEEVVVTADGCQVITLFPAEELMITNAY